MPSSTDAARRWTLAATILGSSLTFIDGTIVDVALPALQSDLPATITDSRHDWRRARGAGRRGRGCPHSMMIRSRLSPPFFSLSV
jgi:hypothetical protein